MSDNRIYYDPEHLRQLRQDAVLSNIDLTRARIEQGANDTFLVLLAAPLVDITSVLGCTAPRTTLCLSAAEAEGTLLVQSLKVQRAERQRVRLGRTHGMSTEQINRRPLTDDELARFRADAKHASDRARLVEALDQAVAEQKRQTVIQAEIDGLAERYGLEPAKATVPNASTVKADPHLYATRQAPSRKGAKR
jgi:hypothetical protein